LRHLGTPLYLSQSLMVRQLFKTWYQGCHLFLQKPTRKGASFGIQQYQMLKYKASETLEVSQSVNDIWETFNFMKKLPSEITLVQAPAITLKAGKVKYVIDLFPYLAKKKQ
jgi:hypothetical protein